MPTPTKKRCIKRQALTPILIACLLVSIGSFLTISPKAHAHDQNHLLEQLAQHAPFNLSCAWAAESDNHSEQNSSQQSAHTSFFLQSQENPFYPLASDAHSSVLLTEGDTYTLQSTISYNDEQKDSISHEWTRSDNQGSNWDNLDADGLAYTIENAQRGAYLYRLKAQDSIGNSATETFHVTVKPKQAMPFTQPATTHANQTTSLPQDQQKAKETALPSNHQHAQTTEQNPAASDLIKTGDMLALPLIAILTALIIVALITVMLLWRALRHQKTAPRRKPNS